ncbi:MAG: DUF5685 family protein [Butyrivibrio sp.]|nr:DUF5685 family protein [Butyrivibrio sp.]
MFGYITVNKDELKIKDYRKYQSYYCGVCRSLEKEYGLSGRMTLTYDMTFLALLLCSLYEDRTKPQMKRCAPHPIKPHEEICNEYTDYAAAVNVMLSYYKLKDDWEDERSLKGRAFAGILRRAYRKASVCYPVQAREIRRYIREQHRCEAAKERSADIAARPTGEMLAGIFDMKGGVWQKDLRRMGFFLGKFIYVMDAFDDLEEDIRRGNYNPLRPKYTAAAEGGLAAFNLECREMLTMYASQSSMAFEALPILDNADILRNILYSGIWSRFNRICLKREKEKQPK